jgi:hypothetical protein
MPAYPDISDYTDSVQNAASQVIDPVLCNAKPRLRGGRPEMMSGGVAVVYPFQDGGKIYAVKCWLRDIGDLRDHYIIVQSFLDKCQSKYFVDFAYIEKGIIAGIEIWPFLRMTWVGGKSLLEFVSANVSDSPALVRLADRYLVMSQTLHRFGVAHGDLQGSNIKVVGSGTGVDFQLIDYDTMIVPANHGRKANAIALPSYQHPKRGEAPRYTGKEDYFSELVIYLSLLAVAEKPTLWGKYPIGDVGLRDEDRHDKDMLFVKEDFTASKPTEVFKELVDLSPTVRNLTLLLWNYTRKQSIEQLLPLEDVVKIVSTPLLDDHIHPRVSAFESLLMGSSSVGTSWLDDSAFVKRTHVQQSKALEKFAPTAELSFDELLAKNIHQSTHVHSLSTNTTDTVVPVWLKILFALFIIFLFLNIINNSKPGDRIESTGSVAIPIAQESQIDSLKKLAVSGDAVAQYQLSVAYATGENVYKDAELAAEWLIKAANQGYTQAQFQLGEMYVAGNGVPKDRDKAVEWYLKAAEKNDPRAQCALGVMAESDVDFNPYAAVVWYSKAANQNHILAQLYLGELYHKGKGVSRDIDQARYWWQRAATLGDADARERLLKLESEMGSTKTVMTEQRMWMDRYGRTLTAKLLSLTKDADGFYIGLFERADGSQFRYSIGHLSAQDVAFVRRLVNQ